MNRQAIFNSYSKIIDRLLTHDFFKVYFQKPWSLDDDILYEYEDDLTLFNGIDLRFGASRCCIVDKHNTYVIKFNLYDRYLVKKFECCQRETKLYSLAKKKNLEPYFTPCSYIGTYKKAINFYDVEDFREVPYADFSDLSEFYNDLDYVRANASAKKIEIILPLFAYKKINDNFDIESARTHGYTKPRKNIVDSPLYEHNKYVAFEFLYEYGIDEFDKFSRFCIRHHINDLGICNFRMQDNKMICTDFSGY